MDGITRSTPTLSEGPAQTANVGLPHLAPARRRWAGLRMHHLLFLAFTLVSAVPLAVLAIWEGRTAFQNELDSVRERHLLVAKNLTSTMSRYVKDVKSAFSLAYSDGKLAAPSQGLADLLKSLNVVHVCVLTTDGSVEVAPSGLSDGRAHERPDPETFASLRRLADDMPDEPVLSKLYHDGHGQPIFYLVKALPNRRMGLGVLSTRYLVDLQQTIAFGDRGHAVITDAKGQVIAHPLKDWVEASRDISGVSVVQSMIQGENGVGQFYSPAFNSMMIAGYAVVPETGWGVMVPQPIDELKRRANLVNRLALVIAAAAFTAAALMSYLIALWLTRPVRRVAATAEQVIAGNDHVSVPAPGYWAPSEIHSLGLAFNTMLEGLRRRAAETMEALHAAETSSHAKTQFLANMSHELRTPLNGVVGMMELLRLSGVSPTQHSYLDQANRSAGSLLQMVNDVLDLSEMEAGTISLTPAPFRVDVLVDTLTAPFTDQAQAKGLRFAVSMPDRLNMALIGDSRRLSQILGNLLSNAIKFTDSGGVALRIVAIGETQSSIQLRFEVGDTGIGIPTELQSRIFGAFTLGDGSMTRRHGGSGLGLAIVKELTNRMNGEFGVDSVVDVGSTFWLLLPFDKASAEVAMTMAPVAVPKSVDAPPMMPLSAFNVGRSIASTGAGKNFQNVLREAGRPSFSILLVEDNPANLRVTQALLETLGCDVETAINGLEAVEHYRDAKFDLVLMDCQMPEMDGYEATREIRRIEAVDGRVTPVIALTAHAMDGSRESCLAAGMNDQLSKPLTLAALTAKLQEMLPLHGHADL